MVPAAIFLLKIVICISKLQKTSDDLAKEFKPVIYIQVIRINSILLTGQRPVQLQV